MKPSFSVVIPCYNEEKYVGLLLADLARQREQANEVIIADSNSTDGTLAVVKKFEKKLQLNVASTIVRTPGAARNTGAHQAKGEYLVFIDADTRLDPDFITKLKQVIRHAAVDYVSPLYRPDGNKLWDRIIVHRINKHIKLKRTKRRVTGIGGVMCIRKSMHDQIGGFDDRMVKENDIDYLERLLRVNPSIQIAEDIKVLLSARRDHAIGRFISFLYFTPRKSFIGKRIIYPFLHLIGKDKEYGIF